MAAILFCLASKPSFGISHFYIVTPINDLLSITHHS